HAADRLCPDRWSSARGRVGQSLCVLVGRRLASRQLSLSRNQGAVKGPNEDCLREALGGSGCGGHTTLNRLHEAEKRLHVANDLMLFRKRRQSEGELGNRLLIYLRHGPGSALCPISEVL